MHSADNRFSEGGADRRGKWRAVFSNRRGEAWALAGEFGMEPKRSLRLMKTRMLLLIPLLVVCLAIGAQLRPEPPRLTTGELMKAKLVAAQKVLEGVTTEDFNLVSRNANLLITYSRAEAWLVQQSPQYARHTEDFRRQASALAREARNKNVDGATVAYFQLTVSCVNCHKFIRSQ